MKYSQIVWDGKKFDVPPEMGSPREDQLTGSDLDNLIELSGRVCYDSLGTGRNSKDYHKHINEVGHGSVQEHANLTFGISLDIPTYLGCVEALINRPGIWICKETPTILTSNTGPGFNLRITANMRAIIEWFEFPPMNKLSIVLGQQIQHLAKEKCPLVLQDITTSNVGMPLTIVPPKYEEETWVSVFLHNVSRGLTHELVRHKYRTAVSQRSTRYVDESESNWCWHPLISKNINSNDNLIKYNDIDLSLDNIQSICQSGYSKLVENLQEKLISEGTDKFTARKQARGAARGILGNALNTELIFSANLAQWKWIFNLRASSHADAEIRVVVNEIYEQFAERFPDNFQGYEKENCADGLGYSLKEPVIVN